MHIVENQYTLIWNLMFHMDDLNSVHVVTEVDTLHWTYIRVHFSIWIAKSYDVRIDLYGLPSAFI